MTARLTRLVLKNWRNFRELDVPLSQRTFLVRPNASGKTNLLDAIRFLRDIAAADGSLTSALRRRGGLAHVCSLHADDDAAVRVELHVELEGDDRPWRYALELAGSDAGLRVGREIVSHGGGDLLQRPLPHEDDERLLTQTHLEQISQSLDFRPLADALAGIQAVHVVPQLARTAARAEGVSKREAPGSDFIDQIAFLAEPAREEILRRIEKLMRIAIPRFAHLGFERDDLGRPHLKVRYTNWRQAAAWQSEQELSDGTLRLIGLLWAVETASGPVLLDEPDLSLHPGIIRQLPRLFAFLAQRRERQVIVSTNAEEIFMDRGIDPGEILIVEPAESGSRAVVGSERSELVAAVRARAPLSRIVTSITQPRNVEQLSLTVGSDAR